MSQILYQSCCKIILVTSTIQMKLALKTQKIRLLVDHNYDLNNTIQELARVSKLY